MILLTMCPLFVPAVFFLLAFVSFVAEQIKYWDAAERGRVSCVCQCRWEIFLIVLAITLEQSVLIVLLFFLGICITTLICFSCGCM